MTVYRAHLVSAITLQGAQGRTITLSEAQGRTNSNRFFYYVAMSRIPEPLTLHPRTDIAVGSPTILERTLYDSSDDDMPPPLERKGMLESSDEEDEEDKNLSVQDSPIVAMSGLKEPFTVGTRVYIAVGQPIVMYFDGPGGSGKSRVVEELFKYAGDSSSGLQIAIAPAIFKTDSSDEDEPPALVSRYLLESSGEEDEEYKDLGLFKTDSSDEDDPPGLVTRNILESSDEEDEEYKDLAVQEIQECHIDIKKQIHEDGKHGMLFPAVGFIEEQGRHTLHVHCLPW
jgi:hypothetical protein